MFPDKAFSVIIFTCNCHVGRASVNQKLKLQGQQEITKESEASCQALRNLEFSSPPPILTQIQLSKETPKEGREGWKEGGMEGRQEGKE